MKQIKILVVDDSIFFRKLLVEAINANPMFEVVATAGDPFEARDMIIKHRPDVMTLDVELPRMNGIEFLKRLIPQYPIPTVVVSALNMNVFDALDAGAVDFVNKPVSNSEEDILNFVKRDLAVKLKIATTAKIGNAKLSGIQGTGRDLRRITGTKERVIAFGASTGGTEAICDILINMGNDMPGIVMTQHMPPGFTRMFASRLNQQCALRVKEAQTGDRVLPGLALLAPGDAHMRVIAVGDGYQVECKPGEKVSGHCPSVDVLFDSMARTVGNKGIGVLLTGMGADGAKGLLAMRKSGAVTIGQDEASCVVYGMPKVAYDLGAVMHQVSLDRITDKLYSIINV